MKISIQHYINPLHLYCRFRDLGLFEDLAKSLCVAYEDSIYKWLTKCHAKCRCKWNNWWN